MALKLFSNFALRAIRDGEIKDREVTPNMARKELDRRDMMITIAS